MPDLTAEFERQLADLGPLGTETGIDEAIPPQRTEVTLPQLVTIEEISERVRKLQNERHELDSDHFSAELKDLENQLISLKPDEQTKKTSRELGIVSVTEARLAFDQGQTETATFFKDLAKEFLDLAMGLNPVTGLAQSVYELMVGESYFTGAELGKFDRTVAFLGIVTAGGGRSVIKAAQGMSKLASGLDRFIRAKRLKGAEEAIDLGKKKIGDSAGKLGFKLKEEILDFVEFTKRTLGNEIGAIGNIEKLFEAAKGSTREIVTLSSQLQRKFKHAEIFGIAGNPNKEKIAMFAKAIERHIKADAKKVIEGTYHQTQKVIHYVDPVSGINVMKDEFGKFLSTWKLNPEQLKNLLERGSL